MAKLNEYHANYCTSSTFAVMQYHAININLYTNESILFIILTAVTEYKQTRHMQFTMVTYRTIKV